MLRSFVLSVFVLVSLPLFANDLPQGEVVQPTDFITKAAKQMEEKKDFQYNEDAFKKTGDVVYSFKYPQNWSIPENVRLPAIDVICMRKESIENFNPNFNIVVIPKDDPNLNKITEDQFQTELQKMMPDWKAIEFEHGKFKEKDVLFVHSQSTVGVKIEQYQYLFNENGKGVVLTFSSSSPIPENVKEEFDAILATFKIGADANAE